MKATELLQKQHRDVEALLERFHAAGHGDETRLCHELAATLVAHCVIEQELFYPAIREALPLETMEALEEHGLVDVELARLLAEKTTGDAFEAKAAVLAEIVVRHIRREESEILKLAERELGDEHLSALGDKMALRFRHVIESGFQKYLHRAIARALPRTPRTTRRSPAAAAKKTARRGAVAAKKTARRGVAAAKKTARRGPAAAKKAKAPRRAAAKTHAPPRRAPTKRAGAKLQPRPRTRKATAKPAPAARARRASTGARRTRP